MLSRLTFAKARSEFSLRGKFGFFKIAIYLLVAKALHFSLLARIFLFRDDSPKVFISDVALRNENRFVIDNFYIFEIADEIATGFGRTGKLFACEHANISPDILCLGKAITGGYLSFAATLCTEKIAMGISEGEAGVFMHGPTFMANPLACSAANASIDLLLASDWQSNVQRIEKGLKQAFAPAGEYANVNDVRVLGAIGVIELKDAVDMHTVQPLFVEHGIWVRPFGKLVYIMPPYVISDEDLHFLCQQILAVIRKIGEQ